MKATHLFRYSKFTQGVRPDQCSQLTRLSIFLLTQAFKMLGWPVLLM